MNQKVMLSVRIPTEMNKALSEKVKPVGLSKCQYVLQLIGRDLGMLGNNGQGESKEKTA